MNKIKILHLISSTGFFGAENVVIELAKSLAFTDFVPIIGVFYNSHNPNTEMLKAGIKNKLTVKVFVCHGLLDLKTILDIRSFIIKNNIRIIHSHGYKSNFYGLLASIHLKNISLVSTCHGWINENFKSRLYEFLDTHTLQSFTSIVTVSETIKKKISQKSGFSNKILTINNGVDLKRFHNSFDAKYIRKKLAVGMSSKVIGTIGRLSQEKGHLYLIRSAKHLLNLFPDIMFLIIGDGALRQNLEAEVHALNMQNNFIFTGMRKDIPEMLSIMDIFVLPSLSEGLPMILLEAMAARKPIIATKVGAIPQVINHDKSGILVKPKDVNELTTSIKNLLMNKNKATLLAKNAYQIVANKYASELMAQQYATLYGVLANRGDKNG